MKLRKNSLSSKVLESADIFRSDIIIEKFWSKKALWHPKKRANALSFLLTQNFSL